MSSKHASANLSKKDINRAMGMMKSEEDGREKLKVREVTACSKFFSSIKTRYIFLMIFFVVVSVIVMTLSSLYSVVVFYEHMDTLNMKERVQNTVHGIQHGTTIFFSRAVPLMRFIGEPLRNPELMNNTKLSEQILSLFISDTFHNLLQSYGLNLDYSDVPFNLVMLFDKQWNERLVYYVPCINTENTATQCVIPDIATAYHFPGGNFTLKYKDKVPDYFKRIKDLKPDYCDDFEKCCGMAMIPEEQGGPMMFSLHKIHAEGVENSPTEGWHILIAFNVKFWTLTIANRTGLCVSVFSSLDKNLSKSVQKEFQIKRDKKLMLNPHDSEYSQISHVSIIKQNSESVTQAQHYYSDYRSTFKPTGREVCDDFYDHDYNGFAAKTYTYIAYSGFDLEKANLTDKESYMIRFDYHDPLTKIHFTYALYIVTAVIIVWVLTNVGVVLHFNKAFLVPLDNMRKARSELIKSSLAGLDDDGAVTKTLFGDMIDDSALIEANGDEITVMLTLQERIDAFYTNVIKSRSDDLARIKLNYRKQLCAEKVMNFFMRRDNDNIHAILPGMLSYDEISLRLRHVGINENSEHTEFFQNYVTAKRAFSSLKAILANNTAAEFFKAFCYQRGRTAINSLFFLVDVSWLHQVEASARSEAGDFFSMFSGNASQAAGPVDPNSPSQRQSLRLAEGLDLQPTPAEDHEQDSVHSFGETGSVENRPRHSHFARRESEVSMDAKANEETMKKKKAASLERSDSLMSIGSPTSSTAALPVVNEVKFLTKSGPIIAHFIYDSYFGHKSLSHTDRKHCALLGCSKVHDYIKLRDKEAIVYSPNMYNNLVYAVNKKFQSEIIPIFAESSSFQMMVYCLSMTSFFEDNAVGSRKSVREEEEEHFDYDDPVQANKALIHGLWPVCYASKKKHDDDSDDSDSSSSSSDEDD